MEHISWPIRYLPTLMMAIGWGIAYLFYIRNPRLPVELAEQHAPLYRFLLNKWYFDELYDFLFVRPVFWLGRAFWKYGDGWLIDGFGPDGVSARVVDITRRVGAPANRLSLPLRVHHADRSRCRRDLVHVLEWSLMSWPVLSVTIFLPIVGALFLMTLRGDDEAVQRNARWIALWTTLITFAVSLVMVWRFDFEFGRISVRRTPTLARRHDHLSHRR